MRFESATHYYYEPGYVSDNRITWAVQRLIFVCAGVFAIQLLLDIPFGEPLYAGGAFAPPGGRIVDWLAFQPTALLHGGIWKPFTYMFLHGGLLHLFLNMLWLYFFGPEIERLLGTRQFVRFFILCGAAGVLATFAGVFVRGMDVSVTGASGAVMGIMVAYAMVNPSREFFLFPIPIPINARALVIILIALNVLTALQGGTTSVATHFGGMLTGYVYMKAAPRFRKWQLDRQRAKLWKPATKQPNDTDPIGQAVDNIFKFEDKKRRF